MRDVFALTAELVGVPSPSYAEGPLVDLIEARLRAAPHLEVTRIGDNLVARTNLGRRQRVVLAGHTDTVPANGNEVPRIEGDWLRGVGSADMKGGLAVMLDAALHATEPVHDCTYVFYAREEVASADSGLAEVLDARPDLLVGDIAILGEPTDGAIEAGCQGSLRVRVTLRGARAHPARPWMGRNAVHRLGPLLTQLAVYQSRRPVLSGCEYRESMLALSVEGGVAGNVVPDEATIVIGHRFAPDRTPEQAVEEVQRVLSEHLEPDDGFEVVDLAAAAPPAVDHPLLAGMIQRHHLEVRAKLGWTDVARFSAIGVPAVNFGPGDATLAHTAEERVSRGSVERVGEVIADLLGTPATSPSDPMDGSDGSARG